jgi:ribosome-associated protein
MNREAARARLVAIVEQATHRPKARRATRASKGERERRLGEKRERSEVKAARQRRPSRDD